MKKMMLVAAMLCVAGMTQAAAVVWGTGALITSPTISGGGGLLGVSSWAAVIKYTGTFAITKDGNGAVTGYTATTSAVKDSQYFGFGVAMTAYKPGRISNAFDDSALTLNDKYAVVVFENSVKDSFAASTGKYDVYLWTVDNATGEDFSWLASQTLSLTATPEPTSLALLAVGAAVIGLRRKFRK